MSNDARSGPVLASSSVSVRAQLLHHLYLGQRLYVYAWVRFLVAFAIAAGAFFAANVVQIHGLEVTHLVACAGVLAAYNFVIFEIVRKYRFPENAEQRYRLLVGLSHFTITVDFIFLTYCIWLVGGARSPFLAFYLVHVILAALVLSRGATIGHALVGYALLAGLVVGEYLGWIPAHRPVGAILCSATLDGRYAATVLVVYGMLMALTTSLTLGMAHLLREGERKLRDANEDLQQLSSMRRTFLHIALHDIKAPAAALSMLLYNLSSTSTENLSADQARWIGRGQERLTELLEMLKDMQVLCELENAQIQTKSRSVDAGELLREVAGANRELAEQRQHVLVVEPPPAGLQVYCVERLLREAVANYITNAIKYTPPGGTITVSVRELNGWARFEVKDTGMGIAAADQGRLFQDFVRLKPHDAAAPAVAGTGLGLSIVRRIAEAHGGRVGVISEPEKGSIFYLELPTNDAGVVLGL